MKRVVIVDDALELGRMLRTALLTLDPQMIISVLPSAEEALLEATRFKVNVLVSDIRLPGMSGFDLVKKFRIRQKDVRVVLITGLSDDSLSDKANELGVDAFFQKPLNLDQFIEVVGSFLTGGEQPPPAEQVPIPTGKAAPIPGQELPSAAPPSTTAVTGEELTQTMANLRQRLGAMAVLLLDERGIPILQAGEYPAPDFDTQWVPMILPALSTNLKLARKVDSSQAQNVLILRGATFDLALAAVGQFSLIVALSSTPSALRLALAVEEVLNVQKELIAVLGKRGIIVQTGEPAHVQPFLVVEAVETQPAAEATPVEEALQPVPGEEIGAGLEELAALLQSTEPLKEQDLDAFWDTAAQEKIAEVASPDVISYEQALRLGLAPGEGEKNKE